MIHTRARIAQVLVACGALVACSKPAPESTSTPNPATTNLSTPNPSTPNPSTTATTTFSIPATTKQLLVAITADWDSKDAELRLYDRDGASWKRIGEPWRGVVGRTGTAWGVGLHGRGAPTNAGAIAAARAETNAGAVPAGTNAASVAAPADTVTPRPGPLKREGDGKSPAGAFALTAAFGYTAAPPKGTKLGYQRVDDHWKCVDDPSSREYNRVLDQRTTKIDWTSAEDMRRSDELYAWVVEVAHNASRTPKDGSCIFLHVWSGPDSATVGCTAMEEPRLAKLVAELRPADAPVFVLLPRAEYDALAPAWNLPR